jgi:M-phase inducer tyrosine phosphatase
MEVDSSFVAIDGIVPSAAPTVTEFTNLFYETMSPSCPHGDSSSGRQPKKRRSLSTESHGTTQDVSSSPAPLSSPSARKLERMSSGPLLSHMKGKHSLQGLGSPSLKRPRRPALSAVVHPSDAANIQSAYPIVSSEKSHEEPSQMLPPVRRAFSALLPPTGFGELSSDESSLDGPDMSSPAQAYAQRQQVKTIRRCDGTDDFRPLTGATAMVKRDKESPLSASPGMPGFGDNESHGKILPCHRVTEDGLMRINVQTVCLLVFHNVVIPDLAGHGVAQ